MPLPPENPDFLGALDAWLKWLQFNSGRSPATVTKYRSHLERFCRWYADPPADPKLAPVGEDPLRPTLSDLELFSGLYAHAVLKLKPRARRPLVSALRGFYAWLGASGRAPGNAAAVLAQPKAGRRLPRAVSLADAERLLMAPDVSTLQGIRDASMLALLMGCGLRRSGLVGLNESSLKWYRDDNGSDRLVIRVLEKGDKERLVPVPNEASLLVRAYLGHGDLVDIDRTLPNGDSVLFVSLRNRLIPDCDYHGEARRLSPDGVFDAVKRAAEVAGVDPAIAHPHALRHLYGAELSEDDVPVLTMQALFGHADPKSTEIYTLIADRKLRKVVDKSSPLAKMRGPLLDSLRSLERATRHTTGTRSRLPKV